VLIERETVDKEELEALLADKWDEYLAKHKDDKKKDTAEKTETPEPEEGDASGESESEPPMAPPVGPPVYDS
jgi:hypothetical protein